MKRVAWALISGLFLAFGSLAQTSLGIDTTFGSYSYNAPTSVNSNESLHVTIKNYGTQAYTGIIHIIYAVDSTGTGNVSNLTLIHDDSLTTTININGTAPDSANFVIQSSGSYAFRQGINTVVIWPRSTSASFMTHDSLQIQLLVAGYAGTHEILIPAATGVYPNPTKQALYLLNNNPDFVVEQVSIWDVEGRQNPVHYTGEKIDLGHLPAGQYYLQLTSKEGKTLRYKVIKE